MKRRSPSLFLALLDVALILAAVIALLVAARRWDPFTRFPAALARVVVGIQVFVLVTFVVAPLVTLLLAALDFVSGARRAALCAAAIAGALLLAPVVWVMTAGRLAAREERRVEHEWGRSFEPMETFLARHPDAPISDGALGLEAAAARAGIEVHPTSTKGAHPEEADAKAFVAVERKLYAYLAPRDGSRPELGAPPDDVAAWLAAHRADVVALARAVIAGGPIGFGTRWGAGDPLAPPLLGLRRASSACLLLAVDRARAGDPGAAREAVEAAWLIAGGARERGDFISQLLAASLDRPTLAVMRQLDPPSDWPDRLKGLHYRRALLRSLQGEGWAAMARSRRVRSIGQGPLLRFMAADYADALRLMAMDLGGAGDPCALDLDVVEARAERSLLSWNVILRASLPATSRGWMSAVAADLDVELTRKVLEARALRNDRGDWPRTLNVPSSSVCPGTSWQYGTEGGVTISLDPGRQVGPPLTFRAP